MAAPSSPAPGRPPEALWRRALEGDRDAFMEATAPHQDALSRAARALIAERRQTGELNEDALNPEELVGEALIRAFDGRHHFGKTRLGLRAWLLGVQRRTLERLARDERRYTEQKAISLDEEVPFRRRYDAVEETFYEFNDPFRVTTYEEIIPGQQPMDVELDTDERWLTDEERARLEAADISPQTRHIIELHDEFELSMPEIAQIMEITLQDLAESINAARVHLRELIGSTSVFEMTRGEDDTTDSYTGEPYEANPDAGTPPVRREAPGGPTEGRLERAARDASPTPKDPQD